MFSTKLFTILLAFILLNCIQGHSGADVQPEDYDRAVPQPSDPINGELTKNFTEWWRRNDTQPSKIVQTGQQNRTKLEILQRILKNPIVLEQLGKFEHKFGNFSRRVKWNLKAFIEEAKSGLNEETAVQLRNTLVAFIDSMELSPLCLMSFVMMKRALANKEKWPLKFYDSMDIIPSGILDGILSSLGQYDECLNIENNEFKGIKMKGQYCLAKFPLPFLHPTTDLNVTHFNPYDLSNDLLKMLQAVNMMKTSYYRIGLCIPSTCTSKEISRALTKILSPHQRQKIEIERECKVKNMEVKKNGYQRAAQSILVTLVLLVVMSSSIELYYKLKRKSFGRRKILKQSLLVFSAISNTKLLFKKDPKRLNIVDTILLIFISLEFLGRSYIMPVFYNLIGLQRAAKGLPREYFKDRKFFWMRNSAFSMTIFILMSSVVLGYKMSAHRGNSKYRPLAYLKYLLNRYLSLLRRIIGPLLLIYLLSLWGDGPLWHYIEPVHAKPCKDNLMASLLFYNNYLPGLTHICNLPSATFSAIFQYQVFGPLILLLLATKLFGYITLVVLVLLGAFVSIIRRLFLDFKIAPYEITQMTSNEEISHSFVHYLGSTEQNIATFIIGLVVGYLIQRKPDFKFLTKNWNLFLWAVFISLPQIASYWAETFKALEGGFSQTSFILWFFSGRILWSLGYGWVVYACSTGRGGYVNTILGQPFLQPLARLAFGIYLNHITIISIRLFAIKNTYLLTHSLIFENVIIDYMIAILVSYVLYILIECPVYHLIKIISGHTVEDVIKTKVFEDNNGGSVRDYEENIEIKLFTNATTNDL